VTGFLILPDVTPVGGWFAENPQYETASTLPIEGMDAVKGVLAEPDRLDEQVAATLDSYGSGR